MELLILRYTGGGKDPSERVLVGTGGSFEAVHKRDVTPAELNRLRRDPTTLATTPPMPLVLVEPASEGPASGGTGAAWGVGVVGAATSPFKGRGVTIAVLDTGIDRTHPAFAGVEIVPRNFTAGNPADVTDTNGHGTHCAGTIFGRDVGNKRIGVAPEVTRAVVGKVLGKGGGTTATLLSAINWALEEEALIISMSLGMDFVGYSKLLETQENMHPMQAMSRAMTALVDNVRFFDKLGNLLRSGTAFGRSALVVAAAGNESDRSGERFKEGAFVLGTAFPAATEDFLSVAALGPNDNPAHPYKVAPFSNAGAKFAGPGVGIESSVPGGGLGVKSGTSMATPHIVGVAALWAQKLMLNGTPTAERVLDKLKSSANVPAGLDEADVGYGVPQAPQS